MTTREHVRAIKGASPNPPGCAVLDTGETLPALRLAQKYAVRVGGGQNQRLAPWHGMLVKQNYIIGRALLEASGGVTLAQLRNIAATCADRISVGKLPKDVRVAEPPQRWRARQDGAPRHSAVQSRP